MNGRRARERRGRLAEAKAVWRLRLAGWRILARRFRGRGGEIDIVALRGDGLAFVEVKARADAVLAAESIAPRQRARIRRAAEEFLIHNHAHAARTLRFDAMLVAPWRLPRHVIDAWRD